MGETGIAGPTPCPIKVVCELCANMTDSTGHSSTLSVKSADNIDSVVQVCGPLTKAHILREICDVDCDATLREGTKYRRMTPPDTNRENDSQVESLVRVRW